MSSQRSQRDAKPFEVAALPTLQPRHLRPPIEGQTSARKMVQNENKEAELYERRFTERHDLNLDDILEYPRHGTDPGIISVFNQEIFDKANVPMRKGSRRDVNEIILCFQRLGYNIYETSIHTDLTVNEILHELDLILDDKKALNDTNCLIVFFLTHGHTNEELHARDNMLRSSEIWKKFATCEELKHKPKMFIFQACKGDFYTTTGGEPNEYNFNDDPSKLIDINNFSANQLGPDMLLVYATIEGNVSFRDPLTGTWFIQELCKNFSSYGRRDDVISMITRTIKCVCGNYFHVDITKDKKDIQKQMPVLVSTLSKKFYLNRSKDRNVLLSIQKETQEIHELVNSIAKHIKIDAGRPRPNH